MKSHWWQYVVILLVGALVVTAVATAFDRRPFLYAFAHVVVALVTIGFTIPFTAFVVTVLHQRLTKRPESTAVTVVGFLIGLFITAPLALTFAFRLLKLVWKRGL